MTTCLSRRVLGVAAVVAVLGSVVVGCSGVAPVGSSESTVPLATLPADRSGVVGGGTAASGSGAGSGGTLASATATTAPVTTAPATTAVGTTPATTATTATTPGGSVPGEGPTVTYRVTNPTGPLATLTTNGAVYIIPAGPSVTLAPSLVVSVTVPPGLDTHGVDIDAVKAAYRGHVEVGDKATHDPTRDWTAEASKYAMEPLLSLGIAQIKDLAKQRVHSEGHVTYDGSVAEVAPDAVQLRICNDVRGIDWVDNDTGISVKPGPGDRRWQDVTVARRNDGRWLVKSIKTDEDAAC